MLLEEREDPFRLDLVDPRQGEADVDQHVIVDLDLGHVLQADPLGDPAELDPAHQHVVLLVGLHDLPGDSEAHRHLLSFTASGSISDCCRRRDRELAQAEAAVAGRDAAMPVDPEAVPLQPVADFARSAGRSGTPRRSGRPRPTRSPRTAASRPGATISTSVEWNRRPMTGRRRPRRDVGGHLGDQGPGVD